MILALRSCVMVWCAAWYFLMCRPGIIPCAVTCTPRYFALVVDSSGCAWQPLEVLASGGAQQYVTFRCIHRPFHIVLVCHLEQIHNANTSSHKESASTMTSSAYRRTGVLSMLPTVHPTLNPPTEVPATSSTIVPTQVPDTPAFPSYSETAKRNLPAPYKAIDSFDKELKERASVFEKANIVRSTQPDRSPLRPVEATPSDLKPFYGANVQHQPVSKIMKNPGTYLRCWRPHDGSYSLGGTGRL